MTIQERILELLEKKGWSKYKLAQEAGLYQTTVYDWFNDKNYTPDRKSIELICAAMDISLTEFYSGIDEGDLDGEQMLVLQLFAKVPNDKKKLVFELLKSMGQEN
ncbi:MAG: helix-turn-helix transcriptional regulator [Clostridiales bacterium]|nr:helix-turn-helix transcriptional regulator [Clostridiales bacterium]